MLKQRILTALVLGPLILWSVIAFSHRALAIELGVIIIIAAWEWARLSGIHKQTGRIAFAIVMMICMLGLMVLMHAHINLLLPILVIVSLWWFAALLVVVVFDRRENQPISQMTKKTTVLNLLSGLVILLGAFVAITGLHQAEQYGYPFILILLAIIWIADSAAYFSGRAFGKHKLAPHISPGKTWEGVLGAVLSILLAAFLISRFLDYSMVQTAMFIIIAVITMLISVVGDLIESLFKRRAGVKDSSQLLPGHGGILDRIDSLVAAAPVFLLGLLVAGL